MTRTIVRVAVLVSTMSGTAWAQTPPTVYTRWHFPLHNLNSGCTAPPGDTCNNPVLAPTSGSSGHVQYQVFGRSGYGIRTRPDTNRGYYSSGGLGHSGTLYRSDYGHAWTAFVYVETLPSSDKALLWHEGGGQTGFVLALTPSGTIGLSVGKNGSWQVQGISTTRRVGAKTWHHVAFVYLPGSPTGTVKLLLNGIEEASAVWNFATGPDESATMPLQIGVYSPNTAYDLDGAIDEVKFLQFSPASDYVWAVRNDHGLHFRHQVLTDLVAAGQITESDFDTFREPTLHTTSVLRAWINSFFSYTRYQALPKDPLSPFPNSAVGYVYPLFQKITQASGPYTNPISLYLNLRDGHRIGDCGAASLALWATYKVFGYSSRRMDWVNGPDATYTNSHVTTEVYLPALGKYLFQDATFNTSGQVTGGSAYSIAELPGLRDYVSPLPTFTNGGYAYDPALSDPIPGWTPPPATGTFLDYFRGVAGVFPSWLP